MSRFTAQFVVQRDGIDYKVAGKDIDSLCKDTDLFYVQRGDDVYYWQRIEYEHEWEKVSYWFHVLNLTEEIVMWPRDEENHNIWNAKTEEKVDKMLPGGEYIIGAYNDENHRMTFEGNTGSWDFGPLTDISLLSAGHRLFADCPNFNGDVSPLAKAPWKNVDSMFENCEKYNQPMGHWDMTHVYNNWEFYDFLKNTKEYDKDLSGLCMDKGVGKLQPYKWCEGSGIEDSTYKHPRWNCTQH